MGEQVARKGDPDRIENPDIEIGASVTAKRLRFRRKPEARVGQAASGSVRENLPEEVEPGVAYSDVRVRWRAAARLREATGRPKNPTGEVASGARGEQKA